MGTNEKIKVVFENGERNKVISGELISEDNFLIKIKANNTGSIIRIGKKYIVEMMPITNG